MIHVDLLCFAHIPRRMALSFYVALVYSAPAWHGSERRSVTVHSGPTTLKGCLGHLADLGTYSQFSREARGAISWVKIRFYFIGMRVGPGRDNHRGCEAEGIVCVCVCEKAHRVKLCLETCEAASYVLEALDMKEVEISNKMYWRPTLCLELLLGVLLLYLIWSS